MDAVGRQVKSETSRSPRSSSPPTSLQNAAHGHSVQLYADDEYLIQDLSRTLGAALGAGDTVIVIATEAHRDPLARRLEDRGLNLSLAIQDERYIALDAAETMSKFMVENWPDKKLFFDVIGGVLVRAKSKGSSEQSRIVAFGEMVAVLCANGHAEAAIQLEQLWNELASFYEFNLHCAYPIHLFKQSSDGESLTRICEQHQHVTPAESYTNLGNEADRLLAITQLQQKARALEHEIRERENAQKSVQEREADLRDFVENAVVPLHWVAKDGTILWANEAELSLLGYSRQEYVGHHITKFHADAEAIEDILQRLARRERLDGYKTRLRCRDGSARTVRIYSNVFYKNDEFVHTRCFTIDVTARERGERRIAAQLALTRLLAEADSVADLAEGALQVICGASDCDMSSVWQVQAETNELRCIQTWHSPKHTFFAFEELTRSVRLKRGEGLPGRVWDTNTAYCISDLRNDANFPRKREAIADGLLSAFAFPISVKGRVWGVIEFLSRQLGEQDEELMAMMAGIGIQMGQFAERKQVDDARAKLAAIVESSDDGIVSKDLNGVVTSWNKGAERIFGYKAEEMIGRPITTIIPPHLHSDEPVILSKIQSGERIDHFETVRVAKNGDLIDVSLTISPVKDENGRVVGAAKIARDITQQKKLERALHTAEKLASVGRLVATVAHEINNPLESVTNFVYLAKISPDISADVRRYLTCADQELSRVAHIARQTLGFYRDNSRPVMLDASKVVDDVLAIYHRKLESKNLRLEKRMQRDLKLIALEGELKQILSNLVSNAIDASHHGGKLWVSARSTSLDHLPGVRLSVADTGNGIASEHQEKLFTPFFTTKKEVGTGLGLWITKELVEKVGGHIRLRSRTVKPSGTVISIFLPLKHDDGDRQVA
jgi:PAS domain S-box-containing protein